MIAPPNTTITFPGVDTWPTVTLANTNREPLAPYICALGDTPLIPSGGAATVPARSQAFQITGASNTTPIAINVVDGAGNATCPVLSGQTVTVAGCLGNTAANGTWTVALPTGGGPQFTLVGSSGNGAYSGGGSALIASAAQGDPMYQAGVRAIGLGVGATMAGAIQAAAASVRGRQSLWSEAAVLRALCMAFMGWGNAGYV